MNQLTVKCMSHLKPSSHVRTYLRILDPNVLRTLLVDEGIVGEIVDQFRHYMLLSGYLHVEREVIVSDGMWMEIF